MSSSSYYNARLEKERRDKLAQDVEKRIVEAECRMKNYVYENNEMQITEYKDRELIDLMAFSQAGSSNKHKAEEVIFTLNVAENSSKNNETSQMDNGNICRLQKMRTKEIMKNSPINKLKQEVFETLKELNFNTEQQIAERNKFISFFNGIVSDESISNNDRREMVLGRLIVLKRKVETCASIDDDIAAKQLRLEALKQLLEIKETIHGTIDEQISSLEQRLIKQEENNLIMNELSDVMKNLGYKMENSAVIDDEDMMLWDLDMTWCDIAIKDKNQIFIIDTVVRGEKKALTDNQMIEIEEEARDVCRQKNAIALEMSKRGIRFDMIDDSPPVREYLKYDNCRAEKRKNRAGKEKFMSLN